jgi:hypothetical protein
VRKPSYRSQREKGFTCLVFTLHRGAGSLYSLHGIVSSAELLLEIIFFCFEFLTNIQWNSKPPGIISLEIEAEVKPKYQGFDGRTRVSTQSVRQSVLKTFMPYLPWLFPFPHSCLVIFKNSVLLLSGAMYLFAKYWVCTAMTNSI